MIENNKYGSYSKDIVGPYDEAMEPSSLEAHFKEAIYSYGENIHEYQEAFQRLDKRQCTSDDAKKLHEVENSLINKTKTAPLEYEDFGLAAGFEQHNSKRSTYPQEKAFYDCALKFLNTFSSALKEEDERLQFIENNKNAILERESINDEYQRLSEELSLFKKRVTEYQENKDYLEIPLDREMLNRISVEDKQNNSLPLTNNRQTGYFITAMIIGDILFIGALSTSGYFGGQLIGKHYFNNATLGSEIGAGIGAFIGIAFSLIVACIIYKTFYKTEPNQMVYNNYGAIEERSNTDTQSLLQ